MRQELSSKSRLRDAAKALFAEKGYETTTIADITRAAKTSHSQFLKYYSGKEELRREIVEQQWSELGKAVILAITSGSSPKDKLKLALNMFVSLLESDPQFRAILLLEQTASRDQNGIVVSPEFRNFISLLDEIVSAMKSDGELSPKVNAQALRSALLGSIEGMMRDQLLANGESAASFSMNHVREMFSMMLDAACEIQRPAVAASAAISSAEAALSKSLEDEWIRYYLKLGDTALNPSELS